MRTSPLAAIALLALLAGCEDYNRDMEEADREVTTPPARVPTTDGLPRDPTPPGGDVGERDIGAEPPTQETALAPEDLLFISQAASGGLFEVESSELALEQNVDPHLRQIAQMMIDDHSAANDELASIAQRKGVSVPSVLQPAHRDLLDQLRNASAADFGARYRDTQIKAHEETIALFEECASSGKDPEIKAFAEKTLTTLRKHLEHLRMGPEEMPEVPGVDGGRGPRG